MYLKRKYNITDLTQWLAVSGIFTEKYYELAFITLAACLISFVRKKMVFSKSLFAIGCILFFYSLGALSFVGYPYRKMLQQFVLLLWTGVAYYQFFEFNKNCLNELFCKYLSVAYVVALLGVIQWIVYFLVQINIFQFLYYGTTIEIYPGIIRITSIVDEPSYLSTLLMPAAIYCLLVKKDEYSKTWHKYIVFSAIFQTLSTVAYVILVLFLVYKYFIFSRFLFYKIVFILVLLLFWGIGFTNLSGNEKNIFSDIEMKISDSFKAFSDMDPYVFESLNLSSYATMTNMWVAINAPLRITGTGLGSHEQNYEYLYQSDFFYYGLNSKDGYSLANRIFSEFGIVGILLLISVLYKNYTKHSIINISTLFYICTVFIRGGNYVRYGVIFFFFLYFYTHYSYLNSKQSNERSCKN